MKTLILSVLLITIGLSSCVDCIEGEGDLVTEDRILKEFEIIVLRCSADLIIHQNKISNSCKATVSAQENLLPYIHSNVEGSKLVIDVEGCITSNKRIEIEIASNALSKIYNDGSGTISSSNILKNDELKIILDGSGDVNVRSKGESLECNLNGSGDIIIDGSFNSLDLELDGAGDFEGDQLEVNSAEIHSDGSGSTTVQVKDKLNVHLDGSGDVKYYGSPVLEDMIDDGSGSIKSMDK